MQPYSPFARVARPFRLLLVPISLLMGCSRPSAPVATQEPVTQAEPQAIVTEAEATAGDTTPEPAPPVTAVEPVSSPEPDEELPVEPVDMTPAAAPALCADLLGLEEPNALRRAAFKRGGVVLPNDTRADVLECEPEDQSVVLVYALLVIRSAGGDYVTSVELAQSSEAGMRESYRLGPIERTSTGVRIRVTTSDSWPTDSGGAQVDRSRKVFTCTWVDAYPEYDCQEELVGQGD